MKWLIALMISLPAVATTHLSCVGVESNWEVDALLEDNNQVESLRFAREGEVFREFSDITFDEKFFNVPFSQVDRLYYKFNFKQKALYLNLTRKVIKGVPQDTATGKLLPRNNIFTPDYEIICTFEEL